MPLSLAWKERMRSEDWKGTWVPLRVMDVVLLVRCRVIVVGFSIESPSSVTVSSFMAKVTCSVDSRMGDSL